MYTIWPGKGPFWAISQRVQRPPQDVEIAPSLAYMGKAFDPPLQLEGWITWIKRYSFKKEGVYNPLTKMRYLVMTHQGPYRFLVYGYPQPAPERGDFLITTINELMEIELRCGIHPDDLQTANLNPDLTKPVRALIDRLGMGQVLSRYADRTPFYYWGGDVR
jgi:hypothetical protein